MKKRKYCHKEGRGEEIKLDQQKIKWEEKIIYLG